MQRLLILIAASGSLFAQTTPTPAPPAKVPRSAQVAGVVKPAVAARDAAVNVEAARAVFAKWTEAQQLLAREKREWSQAEELIKQRLDLLKTEEKKLQKFRDEYQANITDADKKKAEMIATRDSIAAEMKKLSESVGVLETRIRKLVPQLPEPLQRKIQPLVEKMPSDPAKTDIAVPARFQFILGVLQEINKANSVITVELEDRKLDDGKTAQVRTIYVGLGQAYYVTADRKKAGIGTPSAEGWVWKASNDLAPRLADAVDIFQNKGHAHFIPVPVRIQ
jgi:hypothetical protein